MNNNEMLLLKLGEVVLKGQNRRSFEDRLVTNVRRRLKKCGSFQVYVRQSTIYAEPVNGGCDMEAAWRACGEEPPGFEFLAREGLSRLVFLLSAHRPAAKSPPSEKALRDGERIPYADLVKEVGTRG